MRSIETLTSIEGRKLLLEIFHELRYEKQRPNFATLGILWKICTQERDISKYVKKDVTIAHPLGFFSGTGLWMEEIVNRYYFATINSFVYFGAAVLLILIGIRRFSDKIDDTIVIAGIAFESLMLFFMFIIMLFTPKDDSKNGSYEDDDKSSVTDLIIEVGEIATDFAKVVVNLEKLSDNITSLIETQQQLVQSVNNVAELTSQAVSPNPKLLETMERTSLALESFKQSVDNLNLSAEALRKDEIEIAVRKEVERILVHKLSNS